ncbi:hypothetical protein [Streptomyces sp. NPDC048428]|uniref:hypothetical protein n=1 Tax=Streptomyces sp. NPDC048428 TaxID=3154503 RepID=UPI0034205C86
MRPPGITGQPLVAGLGGTFHTGHVRDIGLEPDIVIECTGAGSLVHGLTEVVGAGAVICLTGISSGSRKVTVDLDATARDMALENTVVFGSVNAGRRHYEQAAAALAAADPGRLDRLITRRVPVSGFADARHKRSDDVTAVVDLQARYRRPWPRPPRGIPHGRRHLTRYALKYAKCKPLGTEARDPTGAVTTDVAAAFGPITPGFSNRVI